MPVIFKMTSYLAALSAMLCSEAVEAGPATYSRCVAAANLSPAKAGYPGERGYEAWRAFCNYLPAFSSKKSGCWSHTFSNRTEKTNFCILFICDPTTKAVDQEDAGDLSPSGGMCSIE